jgi:DNA-directed RNA polymerase omega subunit
MIIKPGISALEKCVEDGCRYVLVTMAAKRARMLGENDDSTVECDSENPVSKAVMEISCGKIGYKKVSEKE